jgi:hypothetical protein
MIALTGVRQSTRHLGRMAVANYTTALLLVRPLISANNQRLHIKAMLFNSFSIQTHPPSCDRRLSRADGGPPVYLANIGHGVGMSRSQIDTWISHKPVHIFRYPITSQTIQAFYSKNFRSLALPYLWSPSRRKRYSR